MRLCANGIGVAVALVMLGAGAASAADWPQWRGVNRDGQTAETIGKWPPVELWRAKVGYGYSHVIVSEGRVYTIGWTNRPATQDVIRCYSESSTGVDPAPLWQASYSNSYGPDSGYKGIRATPTVDGNELYTYSHDGRLICYNKLTGATNWIMKVDVGRPGWGFSGSPLVEGSNVIVNAGSSGIAIDKTGTRTNWSSSGTAAYSSPLAVTLGGQRTVLVVGDTAVSGVDPASGAVLWYCAAPGSSIPDPIVFNNSVYVGKVQAFGGSGGLLMDLGARSGEVTNIIWNNSIGSSFNSHILYNGYIYCLSGMDGLACVDSATGNKMWASTNAGVTFSYNGGIILAGSEIVVVNDKMGKVEIVTALATPAGYTETYRATNLCDGYIWTCPTLANGKLYIRTQSGLVVAYDVSAPPMPSNNIPPSSWIEQYYPGTNNYTNAASSDTDGDGLTAWEEYIAGTAPTNAGSCLKTTIVISNGNPVVAYSMLGVSGSGYEGRARYYGLESVTNLTGATWQGIPNATNIPGANSDVAYTSVSPNASMFYRVKARLQ